MSNVKYSVSFIIILALTFMLIGCVKPPESEKSAAKSAMDAAMAAGADKYAVAGLDDAKKKWETAEILMKEKKYKEAKGAYLAAKAAFDKTVGSVAEGKKIAAAEAQNAITSLEEDWENFKAVAGTIDKKRKDDWEADVKAFTDGVKAAKEMAVNDPASVKSKVADLKAIIGKWNTAKTAEMKPASATPAAVSPAEQKTKVIGNKDSKRYHLPGMKYYNAVEAYHRVEFDSEADAVKAGYHKAPR
jgi:hypothetical protein